MSAARPRERPDHPITLSEAGVAAGVVVRVQSPHSSLHRSESVEWYTPEA